MAQADLVLFDGYFFSPEHGEPIASALAVKDGLIMALGTEEELKPLVGPGTRLIDLEGRSVLPGLSDSHVHGLALGRSLSWADLSEARSISELVEGLRRQAASRPEGWVVGFGWDHERFSERRLPTRWDLDQVSAERPVVAFRKCYHLCVVNSAALAALGEERLAELARKGEALRDASTGELNGVLVEGGLEAVRELLRELDKQGVLRAVEAAVDEALRHGLTCLHWIAECPEELAAIMALRASGRLRIRLYLLFPPHMLEHLLALGLRTGFGDPWDETLTALFRLVGTVRDRWTDRQLEYVRAVRRHLAAPADTPPADVPPADTSADLLQVLAGSVAPTGRRDPFRGAQRPAAERLGISPATLSRGLRNAGVPLPGHARRALRVGEGGVHQVRSGPAPKVRAHLEEQAGRGGRGAGTVPGHAGEGRAARPALPVQGGHQPVPQYPSRHRQETRPAGTRATRA